MTKSIPHQNNSTPMFPQVHPPKQTHSFSQTLRPTGQQCFLNKVEEKAPNTYLGAARSAWGRACWPCHTQHLKCTARSPESHRLLILPSCSHHHLNCAPQMNSASHIFKQDSFCICIAYQLAYFLKAIWLVQQIRTWKNLAHWCSWVLWANINRISN